MRWHHVRRAYLALVLSACSSPEAEQVPEPTETPGLVSVAPAADPAAHADTAPPAPVAANSPLKFGAPKAVDVAKPRRLSSGRHGQSINVVVIAADGAGVVTLDFEGHARLWPALDGSREPLALPLISPSEVALHHDADGFAVASLDTGGGLAVLAIDNAGMLVKRATFEAEPPYGHVLATGTGFLALRKDHQLDWIDRAAVRGGSITPPHGERIVGMFAAAGRILSLVEDREGIRGQWLDATDKTFAWGAATGKLELDPERTFMSPDGTRLVAMRPRGRGPAIFNLASGAVKGMKTPDPAAVPTFELEVPQQPMNRLGIDPPGTLLGFATNDRVVFTDQFNGGPFGWYDLRGKKLAQMAPDLEFSFSADSTVFGGGKAVSFSDRELAVIQPTRIDYLGYRTRTARGLRATPAGPVATIGATVLLDDHLRARRRIDTDTLVVDGDLAIVSIGAPVTIDEAWLERPTSRPHRKVTRVALYDRATKKELQSWPVTSVARRVRYEPASKLLVIDHGTKLEFATYDPATKAFGPSVFRDVLPTSDVILLDPALAGGDIAISVHARDHLVMRWRPEHLENPDAPHSTLEILSPPLAIDRAGHIYSTLDGVQISVTRNDQTVELAEMRGWTIRPNADGTRIAAHKTDRVMMFDDHATLLWQIGLPGVSNLAWTTDGALIAQARDLVELSVEDGSIVYAQCGWSFGRRTQMDESFFPTDQTYCDR